MQFKKPCLTEPEMFERMTDHPKSNHSMKFIDSIWKDETNVQTPCESTSLQIWALDCYPEILLHILDHKQFPYFSIWKEDIGPHKMHVNAPSYNSGFVEFCPENLLSTFRDPHHRSYRKL
jgi:hypothetical protein